MPFGLTNAPATFQRLVDSVIGHDLEPFVFQYLDDLIIATDSVDKHREILNQVLNRLKDANLVLNKEKCHVGLPSLRYLGFVLDRFGLHVDPQKVSGVLDFPRPCSVKQVRSFLGMAGWYRRFIPNFSDKCSVLTDILRKGRKFEWTERCEEAFRTLKELLVSAPVLCSPDFSLPFTIQTDASGTGLGAVLTQEGHDGERVISYISRSLSRVERNLSTTHRELLAVIWAIERFRGYVEGYHFTVITDHHSLVWLQKLKNPTGKLCRWALRLQAFDYTIVHRKGRHNVVPDALSRATGNVEEAQTKDLATIDQCDTSDVLVEVMNPVADKWYNRMMKAVVENPLRFLKWRVENYQLFKCPTDLSPDADNFLAWKRVVPKELRRSVMEKNHDRPSCGHLGVYKTHQRIKAWYYWPGMLSDIAAYVRSCTVCQQSKPQQQAPAGLLSAHPRVGRPWQMICSDLVGPFPRSRKGFTFLLVVSDYFSKFVRIFPLRKATAQAVTRLLEEEIFLLFGAPQFILCDNGVQYRSREMNTLANKYGCTLIFNPVYHPQSNPAERVNRTLKPMITSYVKGDQRNWDQNLAQLACAISTSVHEVTGFSPFRLNFGREFIGSGKLYGKTSSIRNIEISERGTQDEILEKHYTLVKNRLHAAFENNRSRYDLRRRPVTYKEGDLVWRKNHVLSNAASNFSAKLAPKFVGPFKILRKHGLVAYELEGDTDHGKRRWHVQDLKPYIARKEIDVDVD